jgi:hypothetical protein
VRARPGVLAGWKVRSRLAMRPLGLAARQPSSGPWSTAPEVLRSPTRPLPVPLPTTARAQLATFTIAREAKCAAAARARGFRSLDGPERARRRTGDGPAR